MSEEFERQQLLEQKSDQIISELFSVEQGEHVEPTVAPPEAESEDFVVESIAGKRKRGRKTEYLVKWKGFEDQTWEPMENLNTCQEMIAEYESSLKTETNRRVSDRKRKIKEEVIEEEEDVQEEEQERDGFARGLKPLRVTGVTTGPPVNGSQLYYTIEFKGEKETQLHHTRVASDECPQLVIAFLQSKLTFNRRGGAREPLENYRPTTSKNFSLFSRNNNNN